MFWMGKTGVLGCTAGGVDDVYIHRYGASDFRCLEVCREWCAIRTEA